MNCETKPGTYEVADTPTLAAPLMAGVLANFVASGQIVTPYNPRDMPHFLYSLAS